MIWWFRVRRWPLVALAVAAVCIVGYQYGGLLLPVPPVFGDVPPIPVAVLLPVLLTSVTMAALPESEDFQRDRSAARSLIVLDLTLVSVAVLLVYGATLVVEAGVTWQQADILSRNTAGLMGAALLMRFVTSGPVASITVAGYTLACTVLFPGDQTAEKSWAWPIDIHHQPTATITAIGLLVLGLAVLPLGPGRVRWVFPLSQRPRNAYPDHAAVGTAPAVDRD